MFYVLYVVVISIFVAQERAEASPADNRHHDGKGTNTTV